MIKYTLQAHYSLKGIGGFWEIDELLQNHGFVTYLPHRDGGLCPSDGRDIKLSRCSIRLPRCRQG